MSTSDEPVKFAYWVPNVSGGLVTSDIASFGKHILPIVRQLEADLVPAGV